MTPEQFSFIKLRLTLWIGSEGSRAEEDIQLLISEVERLQMMNYSLSQGKILELQYEVQRLREALTKIAYKIGGVSEMTYKKIAVDALEPK